MTPMDRLLLALIVFWRILVGEEVPLARLREAGLLPASRLPMLGRATAAPATAVAPAPAPPEVAPAPKAAPAPAPAPAPALAPAPAPAPAPPPPVVVRDAEAEQKARDEGALLMLAALQREGRLLDFLMEKIDAYSDDQVGAAVRGIHSGCAKAVTSTLVVEPVLKGTEESPVTLEKGYDAKAVRLTGNVRGKPPFKGTLKHHGWKVRPQKPLAAADGSDPAVVMPAEVEL